VAGRRHRRVRDAVHAAEAETGLQFGVYLGPTPGDTRELAERLFATAAADGQPAALIVVATSARRVEILTADWARGRLPDEACEEAIALMRPSLQAGVYDDALVIALAHLARVAGTGAPGSGSAELPDLFDEE
jgi:uncharacterized membrane protein YgcG